MKKEILYHYLGVNGTILSPVYLEGIYSVKKVRLTAEEGKRLTKDFINMHISVTVPEGEVSEWHEVNV
jgi:hypothetical protein